MKWSKIRLGVLPGTCGQFGKQFNRVTYSPSKISCTVQCAHASMHYFQNALTYFDTAVSYKCKMCMK